MKLTGNLKKQVEKAETKDEEIRKADFSELSAQSRTGSPLPSVGGSDEKKSLIENAGMLLNDDELEQVSGGGDMFYADTGANHMFGHDDEPPVFDDNGSPPLDMSGHGETMEFRFH